VSVPATLVLPGFRVLAILGRGAFADVWDAVREVDGQPVALKVLRATDDGSRLRFAREASVARRIDSPNVVRVIDASGSTSPPFLAYEKLVGETLDARLERDGWLSLGETWPIVRDVLSGLVAAHASAVVHRDVTPANVFLEAGRACLIDFGVAKARGDSEPQVRTTGGSTLGSIAYMAPEQAGGSADADGRADLYAVGVLAFRALAGRLPFAARSAATMLALKLDRNAPSLGEVTGDQWPAAVEAFLRGTLAREPSRRFESAEQALAAWEAVRSAAGVA
jgi:serine/threonine-protein kinase